MEEKQKADERRRQLFMDWAIAQMTDGVLSKVTETPPTEQEIAEARENISKERGEEMVMMLQLIEMAELNEREAAAKYFDECGSKLTASVLREGRHRA